MHETAVGCGRAYQELCAASTPRPAEYVRAQREYIDGVANGKRTLMRTSGGAADTEWHTLSQEEVEKALKRALKRIVH